MDYEKKYKEALERAKELSKTTTGANYEYIFPELKESEEERTRKALINYFQRFPYDSLEDAGINAKDAIAWLEKQSEQKETLCDKCKKTQPSHSCQDIAALGRCALEKQGEQKPVDKVEPKKFKPGDWVIRKNGATFSNGSICARVRNIEGHKVWFEHGTYADEAYLVKIKEPKYE